MYFISSTFHTVMIKREREKKETLDTGWLVKICSHPQALGVGEDPGDGYRDYP